MLSLVQIKQYFVFYLRFSKQNIFILVIEILYIQNSNWPLLDTTLYTTAQKLLPYSPIATNTCVLSNFCTYFFCHCVPINKLFWTIRMFSFPSFVSNIGTNFHFLILFTLWIYNVRFVMIRQCYVEAFWIHIILHFNGIFM